MYAIMEYKSLDAMQVEIVVLTVYAAMVFVHHDVDALEETAMVNISSLVNKLIR